MNATCIARLRRSEGYVEVVGMGWLLRRRFEGTPTVLHGRGVLTERVGERKGGLGEVVAPLVGDRVGGGPGPLGGGEGLVDPLHQLGDCTALLLEPRFELLHLGDIGAGHTHDDSSWSCRIPRLETIVP